MQDKYITFMVIYMDAETPSVCECWPESRGRRWGRKQAKEAWFSFIRISKQTGDQQ